MVSSTSAIYSKNPSPGSPRAGASSWSASVGTLHSEQHRQAAHATSQRVTANVEASAWAGLISDALCFSDYAVLYNFVLATVVRGGCSRKAVTTVTRTSEAPGDSSGLLLCDLARRWPSLGAHPIRFGSGTLAQSIRASKYCAPKRAC
jgi:hypothetical protein